MGTKLKLGAGRAAIGFTPEMFPNFRERYTHVHDESYCQVLLLESGETVAFVACGTVIVTAAKEMKTRVAKVLDIPADRVIVHAKHVLSMPHSGRPTVEDFLKRAAGMGRSITAEEAEGYAHRENAMTEAVMVAAEEAAAQAKATWQSVTVGFGLGYSEVNVNRVVHTDKGWWQGHNPDGITERTVPVLRFDGADGKPVAILFNCNTAPGVLENSVLSDGRRAASGDMAAAAERWLDERYPGCVSVYTTGATGDQWQSLRALFDTLDARGHQTVTDLHEQGFVLAKMLGERLAEQVMKTAEEIETKPFEGKLALHSVLFTYPGQKVSAHESAGATTDCDFIPDGERSTGVHILTLGDTAMVCGGVELGVRTYAKIREGSPYANTFLVEFANQSGNGGGYMVERDLYEKITYQSRKSGFAAGAAECLAEDVIKVLKESKHA